MKSHVEQIYMVVIIMLMQGHSVICTCEDAQTLPSVKFRSVCYPYVGCFDDKPPFSNAFGKLPKSPDELGVQFRLFTRQDVDTMQLLDYTSMSNITSSNYDVTKLTKFVIHGFANSADSPWINRMKDELLKKGDFNVVVVDWGEGAKLPDYNQAVANLRLVATQVKLLLELFHNQGTAFKDVHLIGHSLGAHMSGYVGLLLGSSIGRITGMDPAEPDFECLPTLVRLDAGDAVFVDIIHTNGEPLADGGAGLFQQSGHVDFYVNGGRSQPGCKDGISGAIESVFSHGVDAVADDVSCSHARSHDIFTESINSQCPFTAYPCESYESFSQGTCMKCGKRGCSSMGYYSDQFYGTGKMFLRTRSSPPYCGYQYQFQVIASNTSASTRGTLFVALDGDYGTTGFSQVTETDWKWRGGRGRDVQISKGEVIQGVAAFTSEVGPIKAVKLKYEKYAGIGVGWFKFGGGRDSMQVSKLEIESGDTGNRFELCLGEYKLSHEEEVFLPAPASGSC